MDTPLSTRLTALETTGIRSRSEGGYEKRSCYMMQQEMSEEEAALGSMVN